MHLRPGGHPALHLRPGATRPRARAREDPGSAPARRRIQAVHLRPGGDPAVRLSEPSGHHSLLASSDAGAWTRSPGCCCVPRRRAGQGTAGEPHPRPDAPACRARMSGILP